MDLFFPPEQSEKFEFKASALKIGFDELTSECAVNVGLLQPQDRLAVIVMCWKTIGDYLTENQYDPFVERAVGWIGRYTLDLWFGRDWSSCATESKTSLIENMMKVYPAAYINMHPYSWPYMFAIYCDPWMVDYLNVNFTRMNTVDTSNCLDSKDSDFIQHEGISLIILRMTSMFDFGMIKLVKFLCLRLLLAWRDPTCAAYMVLHSTPKSALYIELVIHIYLIAISETNGLRDLHYVLEYIQRCQHCNAIEIGPLETAAQTIANVLNETKTGLLEFLNGFILQVPDRRSDNIFGTAVGKYINFLTDYLLRKIHSLSSAELFSPYASVYTKLVGMFIQQKESTEELMKSAAGLSEKLFARVHNLSALTISYELARQRTRPEWYSTKITLLFAIISEELNILEDYKYTDDQKSEEILLKEQQIATYYRDLARLLTKIPYLEQEAWLTTFSLHPCKEYMEAVVKCGSRNLRAIKKQANKFKPIDPAQEVVVKEKKKKIVKKEVEIIKDIPKPPPQLDPELPCTSAAFLASLAGTESKRIIIEPSEAKEKTPGAVKAKKKLIANSEEKANLPKKGRGRPPGKANTTKSVEKKKLFAVESGKKDPDKKTDKGNDAAEKCKDLAEIIYAAAAGAADNFSYQSAEAMKFPLFALINSVTDTEDLIKFTDYDEEITQYNELNRILSNLKTRNTGYNDVLALLISPRYKRLTWVICWKQLKKRCRELTTKDTRKRQLVEQYMADANDRLTYLNIDYDKYKDKPQIDYGSIEDGYECYDTDSEDDTLQPVVVPEDGNANVPPTLGVLAKKPSKVRNPATKAIGRASTKKEAVNRRSSATGDVSRKKTIAVSKSIITQLSQETILENVGTPPAKILEQFASNLSTPIFLSRPVYFVRRPTESENKPSASPSATLRQQNPTTDDQGENITVRGRNKYIILSNTPSPVISQAQSKRSSRRSSANEDFPGSDSFEGAKTPPECSLRTLLSPRQQSLPSAELKLIEENSLGDIVEPPQNSIDQKDSSTPAECSPKVVFSTRPKPLFPPSKPKILRENKGSLVSDIVHPKINSTQDNSERTSSNNTYQPGTLTTPANKNSPVIPQMHKKPSSRRYSINEIPISKKKMALKLTSQKLRRSRHKSVSYHRIQDFNYECGVNMPDSQCDSRTLSISSLHSEISISSPKATKEDVDIVLSDAVKPPNSINQGDPTTPIESIPKTITSTTRQSHDSASLEEVIKKSQENPVCDALGPEKSTNQSVVQNTSRNFETPLDERTPSFSSASSQDILRDTKDTTLFNAKEPLASVNQSCSSQTNLGEVESSITQPHKSIATTEHPTGSDCGSSQSPTQQHKINVSRSKSASIQAPASYVSTTTAEQTTTNSSSLPTSENIETVLHMLYQAFQSTPTDISHDESTEPLESKLDDSPLQESPYKYNNPVDDSILYKDEDKVINNNLLNPHLKTYSNYKAPFRTAKKDETQNSRSNLININVEHTEAAKDETNSSSNKIDQVLPSPSNRGEQNEVNKAQIDKASLQVENGREKSPATELFEQLENVTSDLLMWNEDLPQGTECVQSSSSSGCHLDVSMDPLEAADPSRLQTTFPRETQQPFDTSLDSEASSGDSKPVISAQLNSSRLSPDGIASVKKDSFNFAKFGESSILYDWLEEEELKKPTKGDAFDVCESEKSEKKEKPCANPMSSLTKKTTTELGHILAADDSAVSFEEPSRAGSVVEENDELPPNKLNALDKPVYHTLDSNLSTTSLSTEGIVGTELPMENASEKLNNMPFMVKFFEKSNSLADVCEHSTSDSPISIEKIRLRTKTPARDLMERSRPSSAGSGVESEINKIHEAEVSEESNISCMRSASAGSSALMLSEQISPRFAFIGRESTAPHHLSPDPLALESPSLLVVFSTQNPDDDDSSLSRKDSDSLSKAAPSKRQYRRRNLKHFARRSFRSTRGDSEVEADKVNDCATTSTANNSDGSDYLPKTRRKKVVVPMKLRYRRSTMIDVNECSSCSSNIKIKVRNTPAIKRIFKRRHSTRGARISKSSESTGQILELNASEMEAFERYNCRNVSVSLSRLTTQQAEMCRKPYIKVKRCPLISCLLKRKNEILDSSPVPRKRSRSIFRRSSQAVPLVPCILIRKNEVVEPISFGHRRRSRSSFRSHPTKDISKNMPKLF